MRRSSRIFRCYRDRLWHIWFQTSSCDVSSVFSRISRLFSDAKKILLYSQNDKNLDGFKELAHALQVLQTSHSGKTRPDATGTPSWSSCSCHVTSDRKLESDYSRLLLPVSGGGAASTTVKLELSHSSAPLNTKNFPFVC